MGLPIQFAAVLSRPRHMIFLLLLPLLGTIGRAQLVLTVDRDFVSVSVPAGSNPDPVIVRITNPTDGIYVASIVNGEYVSSDSPTYFLPGNSFADMQLSFNVSELEPGDYLDTIIVNQFSTARKTIPWLAINVAINVFEPVPPSISGLFPSGEEFDLIPGGITVLEGASISLRVTASGTEPLEYQWVYTSDLLFDFVPVEPGSGVSGINSSSISFDSIPLDRSGYYRCVVRNEFDFAETEPFLIQVEPLNPPTPPAITGFFYEAPVVEVLADGIVVFEESPVLLRVEAAGTEPLDYQWQYAPELIFDFVPVVPDDGIFGIDSFSLAFDSIPLDRSGYYRCVVTNDLDFAESEPFLVQVIPAEPPPTAPEIIIFTFSAPSAVTIEGGISVPEESSVSLSVEAIGTEPLEYLWEFTTDLSSPFDTVVAGAGVTGIDSFALDFASITPDRSGYYRCLVSNDLGTAQTQPFLVQVEPLIPPVPPAIVDFYVEVAEASEVPGGIAVVEGIDVVLGVEATGSEPLEYRWEFSPNNSQWALVTPGPGVSGIADRELVISAIPLARTGYYRCVVSNDFGSDNTPGFLIQVEAAPPSAPVVTGPDDVEVFVGGVASFHVSATSHEPPDFRWEFSSDGTAFAPLVDDETKAVLGAGTADLTIRDVTVLNTGFYRCVVSNSVGPTTTTPARLTLLPAPAELALAPGQTITHYVIRSSPFPPATLRLRNTGGSPLQYSLNTPDEPWLGLPTATGTVPAGGEVVLAFPIVDASLAFGEYSANVTLNTNALGNESLPLVFNLFVVDAFTVTTLADSGPGSLRSVIQLANDTPGPQVITFAVEGTIDLESELPPLADPTGGTTISAGRRVFLRGKLLRGLENGLVIQSAGNVVSGLGIIGFPANGILVTGETAQQNLIILCLIGTNGVTDLGNFQSGVRLDGGSSQTTIGGDNDVGNIISGNSFSAISVGRSSGNIIRGNNLGVGQRGNEPLGNGGHGFHILPTLNSNNTIGGNVLFDANVIAANRFSGGTVDVLVGRTVRLRALIHGSSEPNFQWHNDLGPVGPPGRELVIANIQKSQTGSYYCVVSNPAGSTESKRTFLNVLDRKQLAALSLIPAYASLDTNGDGVLTFEELIDTVNKALASAAKGVEGLTREEFDELDLNGDGGLSYQELIAGAEIPLEDVRYEVSPIAHLYPPVDIDEGSAGTQLFSIFNLESTPLEVITTPTLTGLAAAEFSILGGTGADTLGALQERSIEVGSDPALLNERVAYLTIRTDDFLLPTYQVLLSGFGVQSTTELLDSLLGRDAPPRQRGEVDVNEDHALDAADILRNVLNGL